MKKRIISLFLVMTLILTVFSSSTALAQEELVAQPTFSQWAMEDLIVGDTYNIYPMSWYTKNMQAPITHGQLRVLLAGIRCKFLDTDCVIDYYEQRYKLKSNMKVEEVLEFLYLLISDYEFSGNVGITDNGNALEYMEEYGIYTGDNGELSLKDVCSIEQACVIATRLITHVYDALDAASKGFLWEIESGENTVYLLGSVHLANYDIYPFGNNIGEAFEESNILGVEIDIVNIQEDVNTLYMQYGIYTDGTSLKDHVSEETYQMAVMVGANFGITEEIIAMMKPWYLYSTFSTFITTSSGTAEEVALAQTLGIDRKFLIDAYLSGKPIVELESFENQIQMLDSFSDELIEWLLSETLDGIISMNQGEDIGGDELINMLLDYWHKGDVEGFMSDIAPMLFATEIPSMDEEDKEALLLMDEYIDKMLTQRDKGMAEKIDAYLKAEGSSTYFIVVGSAHYISEYSVIDILEDMGYEINQVK